MKAIIIAVVFILATGAFATIINIPDDYPTIQQGIDASNDGDTVLVQPGTYYENINFNGHNIVLGSLFLTTGDTSYVEQTVIDGDSSGSVVTFESGEDSTAIIMGFALKKGRSGCGSGVYCHNSGPIIISNKICENTQTFNTWSGGGIGCEGSSSKIIGNIIKFNEVRMAGAGIYSINSCIIIEDNVISDNTINLYGNDASVGGGGIYCLNNNGTIIKNNIIANNNAFGPDFNGYAFGGGIDCRSSNIEMLNNTLVGNYAGDFGGGVFGDNCNIDFRNNIVWTNSAMSGPQMNIIYSNVNISYCNIFKGRDGLGNIDDSPLFINPRNRNYNIYSQSPCIDSGDPDLTDPDGTRSDIGKYFGEHPECFIGNLWYVSTEGDDSTGDGSFGSPFRTIQHAIDNSIHGDTVIVQRGIYHENLLLEFKDICINSEFRYSHDFDDIENSIIDGDSSGSVIYQKACGRNSIISGFTIQNGLALNGGGIYFEQTYSNICFNIIRDNIAQTTYYSGSGGGIFCNNSDPVVSNNIILNNSAWPEYGGGIYCRQQSNAQIINNVISLNSSGICVYISNALISNNIIRNNTGDQIIYYGQPYPIINYCDIEGGHSGEGNIDVDPLFRDPENDDFHLMAIECGDPYDSPCIDAGKPSILDSLLDCDWGLGAERSDMGAYSGGEGAVDIDGSIISVPARISLSQNYPNPFNASTMIKYELPYQSQVTIEIYDILGRKITTLQNDPQPAGYHQALWQAEDEASGVYFYKLQAGDHAETKKMILIK